MKKRIAIIAFLFLFVLLIDKVEAAYPSYTINPNSKTYQGNMMNYSTYNANTKQYYLLRTYLELFEKKGGGTLILEKGTYTISNTLYVPSNVTIQLKNGVVLNKGTKTGTSSMSAAKSMFQLIRPSKANKKGAVGGYNGEKNIKFIGEGTAKINMNYLKDGIAIIAGHNQNLTIDNIEFNNMNSGHFIELDASKNVVIQNSEFYNSYASDKKIKEAINLDTPDRLTEGWSQVWSTFDKTANDKVTIKNNRFYNLDVAIGTHNYSQGKYHNTVVIQNNTIDKMRTRGIWAMNWSNAIIEKNTIKNIPGNTQQGVLASGVQNPTIRNNQFDTLGRAIQFMVWKNDEKASSYAITYNKLSATNKKDLASNTIKNGAEGYIRFNTIYNNYTTKTEEYSLNVHSLYTKPKAMYASKPQAKAYKSASKTSGSHLTFAAGKQIDLYYQGNNWYYGFIKDSKGATVFAYFHEDEVQGSKPFIPKTLYASVGGAKAYQSQSKTSKVLANFTVGKTVNAEYIGNLWYYGYVTVNGVSTKVYFHEDHVQGSKPFVPKTLYVSKGGAKAYQEMNQSSAVLASYPIGQSLSIEYIGNLWYYGFAVVNGKSTKVYFHEDHVQGSKPFVGKTVYVSEGGAKAYPEKNKSSKSLTNFPVGRALTLEYVGNLWYYGYINYNGISIVAYFHEDNVQGTKPFLPKILYVSPGGAKAYSEMNTESAALETYEMGVVLKLEHINGVWYYGFIEVDGKTIKAYFHEDNVQGINPL